MRFAVARKTGTTPLVWRNLLAILSATAVLLVFSLFLFGEHWWLSFGGSAIPAVQAILLACTDPSTQWVFVACAVAYFISFALLLPPCTPMSFWRLDNPALWLTGLLSIGIISYALSFPASARPGQALALVFGASLGSGVRCWAAWPKAPAATGRRFFTVAAYITLTFPLISLWHSESIVAFQYYDRTRWSGLWDNPNMFALLMGAGIVLALGTGISALGFRLGIWRAWRGCALLAWCLVATAFMARGLFHSFSRGAWIATLCGLACLIATAEDRRHEMEIRSLKAGISQGSFSPRFRHRFNRNWLSWSVIILALGMLAFCRLERPKALTARRLASLANVNDFSWRNRLAAWEGALQITAEHPWLGAGWNRPEPMYERYYVPPKLAESFAIQLNDYLLLGATLGLPALLCFAMYLWSCLANARWEPDMRGTGPQGENSEIGNPKLEIQLDWLQASCRAGAVVLAVGFWFDGGLFKLATAATFWILVELGRRDYQPAASTPMAAS